MTDDQDRLERLVTALTAERSTVAVAESCTGGLLGARLTAVPGASDFFLGGVTAYHNDVKRRVLGVSRESLDEYGAVSGPVAREMAQGARDVLDATWGVSITGVAGPTGGSEETPVGTVFIGVAHAGEWGSGTTTTGVEHYTFEGDRDSIREQSVEQTIADLLDAADVMAGTG